MIHKKVCRYQKKPPLRPAQATQLIRKLAHDTQLVLRWTMHARERMQERALLMGDMMHVLKRGMVFDAAEPTTKSSIYKYRVESTTPNSGGRTVRVVVIPDDTENPPSLKIVTVMWVDER
jgi:Domain of unknown function (DUF4258)